VVYVVMLLCILAYLSVVSTFRAGQLHTLHGPHFQWSIEVYTENQIAIRLFPSQSSTNVVLMMLMHFVTTWV
jgi:hypothetical protein